MHADPQQNGLLKPVNGCGQLLRADIEDPRQAFAADPIAALAHRR
jgi:hypothetical protein